MNVAFLFHLYQPATQHEDVFRKIAQTSYIPLLKFIKKTKDFKVSLNIPLSLLEQMDKYGYKEWLEDTKALVEEGRVELVGSAAYHPLLTKLPDAFVEKQVVLNEYALGYYFGRHSGFEGESAILVKDLVGFFPPELAVNEHLIEILDGLGYEWLVVDSSSIPDSITNSHKYGTYVLKEHDIKIVCRNRPFSNMLSFKRNLDMTEVLNSLNFFKANDRSFVTVLDGEFFGHHYNEGLYLLEGLLDLCREMGVQCVTVSDYVSENPSYRIEELREASWGASDNDMLKGDIYPMWYAKGCKLHGLQWELFDRFVASYSFTDHISVGEDYETLPVWLPGKLSTIQDEKLRHKIEKELMLCKTLSSDFFWWASNKGLPTGQVLFSCDMIARGLDLYKQTAQVLGDVSLQSFVEDKSQEIINLCS